MSTTELRPTVYGIETEYSCMFELPGEGTREIVGACHSGDVSLGLYSEPKGKGSDEFNMLQIKNALNSLDLVSNADGMLSNGGRFYIDPSGPEYATPETASAEEAVHRTFDGDAIVRGIFTNLIEQGVITHYQANRRIVDHNRTSRGVHLNNLTLLEDGYPNEFLTQCLATLNVAKGAIFGSGGLLINDSGDTEFHHSPRLSLTTDVAAEYSSYTLRPLVRIPFKDDSAGFKRVETVTSDALNFAWPLRASLVITNALLSMNEMHQGDKLPLLSDPIEAAHIVGQFGYEAPINILPYDCEEKSVKPTEILTMICEEALRLDESEGHLDPESKQVLEEIIEISDKVVRDPFSVVGQVESVTRLLSINKRMDQLGISLDSERICRFDYAWDLLDGGVASQLRQNKLVGWDGFKEHYSKRTTQKRMTRPPQNTRAKLRGDLISRDQGSNNSSWHLIDTHQEENLEVAPLTVTLDNPGDKKV